MSTNAQALKATSLDELRPPKVSLQTFTIRRYLKSPDAIEQALGRVSELGIHAIELAYLKLNQAEISAVANASNKFGIDVGSSQITYDYLNKHKEWVLDFHLEQLGCNTTSVSVLPSKVVAGDESAMLRFAQELDQLGAYYRERGLELLFHHHDYEFRRYGEQMGLDLLMQNTDPKNVGLVVDTYWTQRGGRSPQDQIRAMTGRVKVIHLRDYAVRRKLFEMQAMDVELGHGNLDISAIVESCKAAGVRYMAIEQACKDPFENVQRSVEHLHALGFAELF